MANDVKIKDVIEREKNIPKGLTHLIEGYMDYTKEVVVHRAIPGIDGFKPSQRRILYIMLCYTDIESLIIIH